jgi:citrate synthase
MLADAIARGPEPAMASALEAHGHLPGFGHPLYPDGDPRARFLLDMIKTASPGAPAITAAGALTGAASRHSRTEPNIDFALAVLATTARMPVTAGETIFTIARTAGWIAHAIEEYAQPPLRFRARAVVRH